jgi:uncharacterized membrane protein
VSHVNRVYPARACPRQSGPSQARRAARQQPAEPDSRQDHHVRRIDAFVYLHVVWFVVWIVFGTLIGFDSYPFGLLTMIVSLEAIFLSTFVMISQNRADAKRQVIADHQWLLVQ